MKLGRPVSSNRHFPTIPSKFKALCLLGLILPLLLSTLAVESYAQGNCPLCLNDYFAQWVTDSQLLNTLGQQTSNPPGNFVPPSFAFSQFGLQMSGLSQDYQFTGMQSLQAFSAPLTFTAFAIPTQGTANPIEVFLVSGDLTQYVEISVNFSPDYDGIWVNARNIGPLSSLGEQFSSPITPSLNNLYQFIVTIDASGNAAVTVKSSTGTTLGTLSGLQTGGTGPFYVVLGQRIGLAPEGSQLASYKSVSLNPR